MDDLTTQNRVVDYVRDMSYDGPVLACVSCFSSEDDRSFYVIAARESSGYRVLHREVQDVAELQDRMVDYFRTLLANYSVADLLVKDVEYDIDEETFYG